MNSDIILKIDELFDDLKETDAYKNYISAQKQLKNNKEITDIITNIKRLQRIAVNNKDEVIEKELKDLYDRLDSYPLYQSYIEYKEEIENNLQIISKSFDNYFHQLLKLAEEKETL